MDDILTFWRRLTAFPVCCCNHFTAFLIRHEVYFLRWSLCLKRNCLIVIDLDVAGLWVPDVWILHLVELSISPHWFWASCIINLWAFCTPFEYVISLIHWSLGCVHFLNHIYLTLTTSHRSKIPLWLILSTCCELFYFDLFILINRSGIFIGTMLSASDKYDSVNERTKISVNQWNYLYYACGKMSVKFIGQLANRLFVCVCVCVAVRCVLNSWVK